MSERTAHPGPWVATLLTVVSAAAVFFWWIAVVGPLGSAGAVLVSALFGRAAVAVIAARHDGAFDRSALGLCRPGAGWLLPTLLLVPALVVGLEIQALVLDWAGASPTTLTFHVGAARLAPGGAVEHVVAGLAMIAALPIGTELLFRGIIQGGLARRWGPWRSALLTALLTAAAHSALVAATGALAVAIVASGFAWALLLCHVRAVTRSVVPAIVLHAAWGAAWFVPACLVEEPVALVGAPGSHLPLPLVLGASVAAAAGLWLLHGTGTDAAEPD